MFLDTVTLV